MPAEQGLQGGLVGSRLATGGSVVDGSRNTKAC